MKRTLIVITGHPGSGKSTLARQLAERYHIPYISKDSIKEHIFDVLGSKDKDWSLKVSTAAHRIMDDFIVQQLQSDGNIIVESNFKAAIDSDRFSSLVERYHAVCIQILCQANGDVLFERWNARIANGSRHEGHVEAIGLEQIRNDLTQPYAALRLPGKMITVDTSDVSTIVLPALTEDPDR